MTLRCDFRSLIEKCTLLFIVIVVSVRANEECDRSKCPGPLAYYQNLGCKAVYGNQSDCCAIRYDCDHLKLRSKDKCYVNGNEYSIGEYLKQEDSNPCDVGCICLEHNDGFAAFVCAIVDCPRKPIRQNCYQKMSPAKCCRGKTICLEGNQKRPTCNVNGKIYYDGQRFVIPSDPDLICYCQPGYEGKNVEPFCKRPNRSFCSQDFHHPHLVYDNCAPVYDYAQSPNTDCSYDARCQKDDDTVLPDSGSSNTDESMMCHFGNLKMQIGDRLSQPADNPYPSPMNCTCEVPPVPTCQYEKNVNTESFEKKHD